MGLARVAWRSRGGGASSSICPEDGCAASDLGRVYYSARSLARGSSSCCSSSGGCVQRGLHCGRPTLPSSSARPIPPFYGGMTLIAHYVFDEMILLLILRGSPWRSCCSLCRPACPTAHPCVQETSGPRYLRVCGSGRDGLFRHE